MAYPSEKAPEVERLINSLNPLGVRRVDQIIANKCSWCGNPATDFRNDLSRKEYTISGFCQSCQDSTFGRY
jgi:hypothetical protein